MTGGAPPTRGSIAIGAGLAVILALAAWLRLEGLSFGLPAIYNPDEVAIMSRALGFARGDLNPHNFLYPTFYFYVLFAWIGAFFAGSWVLGLVPSAEAFQTRFFVDPSSIYLAGRALGVVCGVATVAAVYLLGRRLFDRATGLCAALFLAAAPTAVRDAHYVKHDVPVTLAVVAAYLAIATLAQRDPRRSRDRRVLLLAGALCGVAFSTHYYTVFLALPLALALLSRRPAGAVWRDVLPDAAMAFGAATVAFFGLSPFLLVEPGTAWQDIVANRQIVMDRAVVGDRGLFASAPAYARLLWSEAAGWPVLIAALGGVVLACVTRGREAALLLAFVVPFFAFISNTVAASRYLNPLLPFVVLFAGLAVSAAARAIGGDSRTTAGVAIALALLVVLPGLRLASRMGRFFEQVDVRTLAEGYLESRVPPGATVLVQPYSVQLEQSRDGLLEALAAHGVTEPTPKFALRLALSPYPSPAYRTLFLGDGGLDADKIYVSLKEVDGTAGLASLRGRGVQYVVLKRYNSEDLAVVPLRAMLAAEGRLLAEFSPYRADSDARTRARVAPFLHNTDTPYDPALERPGPGIEIWSVSR